MSLGRRDLSDQYWRTFSALQPQTWVDGRTANAASLVVRRLGSHRRREGRTQDRRRACRVRGPLRDLIRLADASPRERERAFTPALWATLDQARLAEREAA
jgi:hypothetical protein